MNIVFEDVSLEELYVSGTTTDNRYRKLAKDVVKQYVKVVNYIRAARRIEDRRLRQGVWGICPQLDNDYFL